MSNLIYIDIYRVIIGSNRYLQYHLLPGRCDHVFGGSSLRAPQEGSPVGGAPDDGDTDRSYGGRARTVTHAQRKISVTSIHRRHSDILSLLSVLSSLKISIYIVLYFWVGLSITFFIEIVMSLHCMYKVFSILQAWYISMMHGIGSSRR